MIARCFQPRPRPLRPGEKAVVLLTGTFYSENWIAAHLRPLAASRRCRKVYVVSTYPIPATPKVVPIYPPRWLCRLLGAVPARLLTFVWAALTLRPQVIGGFHLLVNGLLAAPLARLVGARSLYFCVGGPTEVLDGGIWAENRLFGLMKTPDPAIERMLIKAIGEFDLVVTMGRRAVTFFQQRGVRARFQVISGGIDADRFHNGDPAPVCDLVLVGRLAPIKRVDLFLRAVGAVSQHVPTVSATIVGDGVLRPQLEELARDLHVAERVRLVGQQRDVEKWLRQSRIFVLTSDSEGLALSLMEAMMCGLPAVVSDVGELGELVEPGVSGQLVKERSPEAFAAPLVELLSNPAQYAAYSTAARRAALRHEVRNVRGKWDETLDGLLENGARS